jgi:acyl carrier protein
MTTIERLRGFITENFYVPDPTQLTDDASLLDSGVVDSTGVMEIVTFIEGEFGIKVEDTEVVPDNLDTIGRVAAFVERKRGAAPGRD